MNKIRGATVNKREFYKRLTDDLRLRKNYVIKHDGKELYIATVNNYVRVNFNRNTVTVYNDLHHDIEKYYYTGNIVTLTADKVEEILGTKQL